MKLFTILRMSDLLKKVPPIEKNRYMKNFFKTSSSFLY